jgi:CBS domain containing-hemolysin-like protein
VALTRFLAVVSRLAGGPGPGAAHGGDARAILKEDEFLLMVEEANREGSVDPSELGLIRRVFDLDETPVSEVYTPIIHVHTLSVNTTVKGAIAAMRAGQRYSRIPVTAGPTKKQVVGVLYTKDLLLSKLEPEASAYATVSTLMRKPFVVSPSARLTVLFRKFKQHKTHMAIVESAPGEAVGIVTMADVLGALFEDLLEADEDDESTAPGGAR